MWVKDIDACVYKCVFPLGDYNIHNILLSKIVIIVGNGNGDLRSNSEQGCLCFNSCLSPRESHESNCSPSLQLSVNSKADWFLGILV